MADEQKNSGEIDDWLADLDNEPEAAAEAGGGELDQSDIDSLLGGGGQPAAPDPGSAAGAPAESAMELDQSDIDSLFGGKSGVAPAGKEQAAAPAPAGESQGELGELSQAGIDDLLGGSPEGGKAAAAPADIAQPDIDDLFGESSEPKVSPLAEEGAAPSQEEMDDLFGTMGISKDADATKATGAPPSKAKAADEPGAETVTFSDVLGSGGAGDDFSLEDDGGFGADAFDFDDSIPDIPDESAIKKEKKSEPSVEDIFADEGTQKELSALLAAGGDDTAKAKKAGKPPFRLPAAINKTTIGASLLFLLVIGGGAYYFLTGEKPAPPAIPVAVQQQVAEAPPAPPPRNNPPTVQDEEHRIDEKLGAVAVLLSGQDADSDALRFEIIRPPEHGRLSGDLPNLTYLPNKDFPGEDSFEFLASDGKDMSAPAKIKIVGADLRQQAVAEAKEIKPAKPMAHARDIVLSTLSTKPLEIDWKKIWRQANRVPFSSKVKVEIVKAELSGGKLVKTGPSQHRYVPDIYFGGNETIEYRFQYGGMKSKIGQLLVQVKLDDTPPVIQLQPLAAEYKVGETVVLDARQTKDNDPATLVYDWRQVGGVAVQLEPLNEQGSMVAFVMPSFFYTLPDPQPVLQLTVIDRAGQRAAHRITVEPSSRRETALWGGLPGGGLAAEPGCPKGDCPGELLPWPYTN